MSKKTFIVVIMLLVCSGMLAGCSIKGVSIIKTTEDDSTYVDLKSVDSELQDVVITKKIDRIKEGCFSEDSKIVNFEYKNKNAIIHLEKNSFKDLKYLKSIKITAKEVYVISTFVNLEIEDITINAELLHINKQMFTNVGIGNMDLNVDSCVPYAFSGSFGTYRYNKELDFSSVRIAILDQLIPSTGVENCVVNIGKCIIRDGYRWVYNCKAFKCDDDNTSVKVIDGILYNKTTDYKFIPSSITGPIEVLEEKEVTLIDNYINSNCSEIIIHNSLKIININYYPYADEEYVRYVSDYYTINYGLIELDLDYFIEGVNSFKIDKKIIFYGTQEEWDNIDIYFVTERGWGVSCNDYWDGKGSYTTYKNSAFSTMFTNVEIRQND